MLLLEYVGIYSILQVHEQFNHCGICISLVMSEVSRIRTILIQDVVNDFVHV